MKSRLIIFLFLTLVLNSKYCFGFQLTDDQQSNRPKNYLDSYIKNQDEQNKAKQEKKQEKEQEKEKKELVAYLGEIKKAINQNDYSWITSQFGYPICLEIKTNTIKIYDASELIKYKDLIFTSSLKNLIISQNKKDVFLSYYGILMGDGDDSVYFDTDGIKSISSESCTVSYCTDTNVVHLPKKTLLHPYLDLNCDWKMTDYQLRGVGAVDEDEAEVNMGKIASISSNVITLNCFGRKFKCYISKKPKIMKRDDFYFWDPAGWGSDGQGGLRSEDFNFSDQVFVYQTKPIGKSLELREVVVDQQKQKMILMCAESGFYLFERIEK